VGGTSLDPSALSSDVAPTAGAYIKINLRLLVNKAGITLLIVKQSLQNIVEKAFVIRFPYIIFITITAAIAAAENNPRQ
jgi:hypothetical protein